MRLWRAEEMAKLIGWNLTIKPTDKQWGGNPVDYLYAVQDTERVALLPFSLFLKMSNADFKELLDHLPKKGQAA